MDVANFDVKALVSDPNLTIDQKMDIFKQVIDEARRQKLYLYFRTTTGPSENHIEAISLETGRPLEMIMMAANNYLGLTTHPEVVARTKAALDVWGVGMAGPCTLNGNTTLHQQFEAELAAFKGCESSMIFPSGYSANIGVLTAILGQNDHFIGDEHNHASLIDGARYSKARREIFRHNDVADLERVLKSLDGQPGVKLVAVDGVYSMSGDIAPLDQIVPLCKRHGALLLVDDAHGTGAVGKHGHGAAEVCGVQGQIDIVMGTFSKAFGCFGGFIAGAERLIHWLRHFARSGMFTAAVSPMVVAACQASLHMMQQHPELIDRLHDKARLMRTELRAMGFEVGGEGDTPILAIYIRDRGKTYAIVKEAYERGLFLAIVEYPAVAPGTERIRLTVSAAHTDEDITAALGLLKELGHRYGALT
jgi:8-amino-7-oxononanoate synthase